MVSNRQRAERKFEERRRAAGRTPISSGGSSNSNPAGVKGLNQKFDSSRTGVDPEGFAPSGSSKSPKVSNSISKGLTNPVNAFNVSSGSSSAGVSSSAGGSSFVEGVKKIFDETVGLSGQRELEGKAKIPFDLLVGGGAYAANVAKMKLDVFKDVQKFGLKVSKPNKIDLDYMLRLGDYTAPIGTVQTTKLGVVAQNTKTLAIFGNKLKKHLSKNAMKYVMSTWIGSVIIGQWGRAESPEPFSYGGKEVFDEAVKTNDWTTYDEFRTAEEEIKDVNFIEEVLLWTFVAAPVGIRKKIDGYLAASKGVNAARDSERARIEAGLSDDDMWDIRNAEKRALDEASAQREADIFLANKKESIALQEAANNAKFAEEKKILLETIDLWAKADKDKIKRAKQERIAIAEYWLNYNKELRRIQANSAPSSLNFGLI